MEGQPSKRRRVYSLEPTRIAQAVFARNYTSYLVPALMKLKEKKTAHSEDNNTDEVSKAVRHEVGMAMVRSAPPGFAWTKALNIKLQTDHTVNLQTDQTVSLPFSSNPKNMGLAMEDDEEEEEGFRRLRRLIPGGEEIGDDEEMVSELESYVRCLQSQVNILHCLTQTP